MPPKPEGRRDRNGVTSTAGSTGQARRPRQDRVVGARRRITSGPRSRTGRFSQDVLRAGAEPIGLERRLAERARIDAAIDGRTVCDLLDERAAAEESAVALAWRNGDEWTTLSWHQYRQRVEEVAEGLRHLGVGSGDTVALMMTNRPEHVIADLGAVYAGATPVSVYMTSSPEQISYICADCAARVAVVEDPAVLERWAPAMARLPGLEHVVVVDQPDARSDGGRVSSWEAMLGAARDVGRGLERESPVVRPADPLTIVYTSGTTGGPKGVVITHRAALWAMESLLEGLPIPSGSRMVSYLPLAHVAERFISIYVALRTGTAVHFCPDPLQVFEYVAEIRPSIFVGVPRVWEKLAAGIRKALPGADHRGVKRKLTERAVRVGIQAARREAAGDRVPASLRAERWLFDRLVYSRIRAKVGLDDCRLAFSGAAPLAEDTASFFAGIGIPLLDSYGMTETSFVVVANRPGRWRPGTVGTPLPGVELRLLPDGELLVRAGSVAAGYLRRPEETGRTFDHEGWVHTGDIAEIDGRGFVRIVDRKKELVITAAGKNVSPATLEGLLRSHPLIGQVCVVGDRKPYVSALITLERDVVAMWAKEHGVGSDFPHLAGHEDLLREIASAVDAVNARVSRAEQIKRFRVLSVEWSPLTGELTPTLKLKRRVIVEKHASDIEDLYRRTPQDGTS